MWNQSIEKLTEEVEKRPALYLKSLKEYPDTNHKKLWEEVCTAMIENWNGLAPEEEKKIKVIIYTLGTYNLHKLHTVLYIIFYGNKFLLYVLIIYKVIQI
jgi:hypothetical protein